MVALRCVASTSTPLPKQGLTISASSFLSPHSSSIYLHHCPSLYHDFESFRINSPSPSIVHYNAITTAMKPYKFPSSGNCSPRSPPASPRPRSRSPRYRHRAGKTVRPASKSLAQRLGWLLLSLLLKRQGLFLFAPLLYLSVMLFYMGTVSYDIVPVSKLRHPPGSVYRSPQLYAKLRSEMDSDNSSVDAVSKCCNWRALLSNFLLLFSLLLLLLLFGSSR